MVATSAVISLLVLEGLGHVCCKLLPLFTPG